MSSPDGKFIVMVFMEKEVLRNYFARMLIQSSFPMYGSYFVTISNFCLRANSISVQQLPFRGEKKDDDAFFFLCVIRCLF